MVDVDIDFYAASPMSVELSVHWIDGTDSSEQRYQVHRLDPHTFIIRQSRRTSPEAPFVYLFFGNDKAVPFDTGDSKDTDVSPLRNVVDQLLQNRLAELTTRVVLTHVFGCQIEMARMPGADYPLGARSHPDKQALQMTVEQLLAVRDAAIACADEPGIHRSNDAIIYNGNRMRDRLGLLLRSLRSPLRK